MSNFLMFVMVAALFVHTFSNFLLGVYGYVRKALNTNPAATSFVSSLEDLAGKLFAKAYSWVMGFFKKS